MDDYELPTKKRKYTKRKKDEDPESKQDPEQEIVRYVEDLQKEAIRQQKLLELSRAKHRQIISSFAKMLDCKGIDSSRVVEFLNSSNRQGQADAGKNN